MSGVPGRDSAYDRINEQWEREVRIELAALHLAPPPNTKKKVKTQPKRERDMFSSLNLAGIAEELFADHSQNSHRSCGGGKGIKTITTKTELYSYAADRQILAREHFRFLMLPCMNFGGLSNCALRDLAGHSLSGPTAALLQVSLLLAAEIPDLWEFKPAVGSFH